MKSLRLSDKITRLIMPPCFFLFSRRAVDSLLSLFLSTSLVLVLAGRPALQADVSRIKTGRGGGGGGGGGKESWALMFVFISKTAVKHD